MDARHDAVLPARQEPQHRGGADGSIRLSEDRPVAEDERVGREHPVAGVARGHVRGLSAASRVRGGAGRLAGKKIFGDAGRVDGRTGCRAPSGSARGGERGGRARIEHPRIGRTRCAGSPAGRASVLRLQSSYG